MVQMHWDDAEELLQDVLKDGVEREGSDSHCPEALLLQAQLLLRLLAGSRVHAKVLGKFKVNGMVRCLVLRRKTCQLFKSSRGFAVNIVCIVHLSQCITKHRQSSALHFQIKVISSKQRL